MIEISNLTKRFGQLTAVEDVSFSVAGGEILGLLGPNGAGKSTTMKILTGFLTPTAGRIRINGLNPGQNPLAVRRLLGYLPENAPLYAEMFVDEYLAFVARVKGAAPGQIDRVAAECRLEHVFRRQIGKLSKGYRQRVGLAQALLGDPEVLILDEPTIGLDPSQIIDIRRLIRSLAGEKTIILSSHILPEVSQTCDRVVIIADGRVVAEDAPEVLTRRDQTGQELSVYLAAEEAACRPVLDGLGCLAAWRVVETRSGRTRLSLTGRPGLDIRAEAARAMIGGGLDLLEMHPVSLSLEDVFVRLVREEADPPVGNVPTAGIVPEAKHD